MNKTLLYLLSLLLGGMVLGSSLAFLTSINNQKLLTAALYNPPSCPFHIGLTPYSINNDKDFEEAVLLKAFFNYAVIDKNNTPICSESDNLNTCLGRFQNFCYSQGKCDEKYDPSKGAATITPQIQSYLCTLWTQRHTKLFDSWTKVTSLFKSKNIPVPIWLTTSRTNYLTWKNQQDNTTTTTILSSNSNLNITFPKVSQPTLFVYPDPSIIKSIVPEGYDYFPRVDWWNGPGANDYPPQSNKPVWQSYHLNIPAQVYTLIPSGTSRQFRAVIVYPDGTHTDPLDNSKIKWTILKTGRCNIWGECPGWTNDDSVECTVPDFEAPVQQYLTLSNSIRSLSTCEKECRSKGYETGNCWNGESCQIGEVKLNSDVCTKHIKSPSGSDIEGEITGSCCCSKPGSPITYQVVEGKLKPICEGMEVVYDILKHRLIRIPDWCYEYPPGYKESQQFSWKNLEQLLTQMGIPPTKFRSINDTVQNCRLNDTNLVETYESDMSGYHLTPQQQEELNVLIHKNYPYFDNFWALEYQLGKPVKTVTLKNNGITVDNTGKVTLQVPFTAAVIQVSAGSLSESFIVANGVSRYAGFGTPCGVGGYGAADFFVSHSYGEYGKGSYLCGSDYSLPYFENGSFYDAIVMLPKSQGTFSPTWINHQMITYQMMSSAASVNYDLNHRGLEGLWVYPWNSKYGFYQIPIKLNININGPEQLFKVTDFSLSNPARKENIPISWNPKCPVHCNK